MKHDPKIKKEEKKTGMSEADSDKQKQTSGVEKLKEDDSALHEETRIVNEQEQDLIINPSDDYLPGSNNEPVDYMKPEISANDDDDDDDDDDEGMDEEITPPDEPGIEIPHLDEDDDADDVRKKLPRMIF